jgi:hypothetical protein
MGTYDFAVRESIFRKSQNLEDQIRQRNFVTELAGSTTAIGGYNMTVLFTVKIFVFKHF